MRSERSISETADNQIGSGALVVLALAGAKLLFHLLIANRYGIFRDELHHAFIVFVRDRAAIGAERELAYSNVDSLFFRTVFG